MESAKSPPLTKIQASNEIIWFEMHGTDQQTPRRLSLSLSLCTFRFHDIDPLLSFFFASRRSSLHKIGITWTAISPVSLLSCYIAVTMHLAGKFSNYFLSLSHKNKKTCELQNHRVLDLASHPALDPCPVKLGREPKWRHLEVLWRGL